MKIKIYIIIILSSIVFIAGKCDRITDNKNNTEEQIWWNTLNKTWKIVFLREIDKIGKEPSEEDLLKIINLEKVNCDHFPLGETNLDPLRKLKRLKSISAGSTFIQNINALADLDSLIDVCIPDNHVSSLEALRGHKMLESIYIQMNDIKDLNPLADKNKLQVLVVFDTKIETIAPVMELPILSIFQVSEENIPAKEKELFKQKHPDCDVNF